VKLISELMIGKLLFGLDYVAIWGECGLFGSIGSFVKPVISSASLGPHVRRTSATFHSAISCFEIWDITIHLCYLLFPALLRW
jgi:hypothetical protein